jgi:hypothetical protein
MKSAKYLSEMETGKKCRGIGQAGGRERQREWIKRREREN